MSVSAAFPKCSRLLTSEDYAQVFNNVDQRAGGKFFLFLIKQTEPESIARVGVIAAKKHAKLAVQRNRLKRLIRESFRIKRATLSSLDLVILIKHGAAAQTNEVLRKELDYLWRKVKPHTAPSAI